MKKLQSIHKEVNITPITISVNLKGWNSKWIWKLCKVKNMGVTANLMKEYTMSFFVDYDRFFEAHCENSRKIDEGTIEVDEIIERSRRIGDKIVKTVNENYKRVQDLPANKIIQLFSDIFDLSAELCSIGYIAPLADMPKVYLSEKLDDILKEKIKNLSNKQVHDTKLMLIQSDQKTPQEIAKEEMLQAIIADKKDWIDDWLKKWFWLDFGHKGRIKTKEYIKSHNKLLIESKEKASSELKHMNRDINAERSKLMKELKFDKQETSYFNIAQKLIFLKAYRADVLCCTYAFFDKIFDAGEHEKIAYQFSTREEIVSYLKGKKPDMDAIKQRKKESIWITDPSKDHIEIKCGKEAEEFKKHLISEHESVEAKHVRGNIAFPGKISGTARIIHDSSEISKVNKGDILITWQTTPEFIPAMKKAAGFVTDVGGITSHAAIVAREMKKPCIIGTKHATKIFKDGELIEVDAERGMIKKL